MSKYKITKFSQQKEFTRAEKSFSSHETKEDKNKEEKRKMKDIASLLAAGSLIAGGSKLALDNKSKITGLENFYHSADRGVINNIKKEGLRKKYAEDPNNLTNTIYKKIMGPEKLAGKVYLARSKSGADSVGEARDLNFKHGSIKNKSYKGISKTFKVNIPYEDFKKMKKVDNPECAKNGKEQAKLLWKSMLINAPEEVRDINKNVSCKKERNFYIRLLAESNHRHCKRDVVLENDIDPKYIKDSKKYEKYGIDKFKEYVKNNPKRFGKGLLLGGLGLGAVGVGTYTLGKYIKKKLTNKKNEKRKNKEED